MELSVIIVRIIITMDLLFGNEREQLGISCVPERAQANHSKQQQRSVAQAPPNLRAKCSATRTNSLLPPGHTKSSKDTKPLPYSARPSHEARL